MYDLYVLGQLMSGQKHGYLLQEHLKLAVGPVRRISSGTLYPLLSRLVVDGWITLHREEEQDGGRPRKLYRITEAGIGRFHELMNRPLEPSGDAELVFHFKMTFFHHVGVSVRLACLRQYHQFLESNLRYVESLSPLVSNKPIDAHGRSDLMRVFSHRQHVHAADLAWIAEEIERMKRTSD